MFTILLFAAGTSWSKPVIHSDAWPQDYHSPATTGVGMPQLASDRPLCLIENATHRQVCKTMDGWRTLERKLDAEKARRAAGS